MSLETWFGRTRSGQPRHTDGRFTHREGTLPEVSLNETAADYGATGRDVLRYAAVQYGIRWASTAERQQVIDDYTAEFAVAAIAASATRYTRHQNDAAHQRWCEDARRTDPELAKVLLHEDDPASTWPSLPALMFRLRWCTSRLTTETPELHVMQSGMTASRCVRCSLSGTDTVEALRERKLVLRPRGGLRHRSTGRGWRNARLRPPNSQRVVYSTGSIPPTSGHDLHRSGCEPRYCGPVRG